jgi:peptidoglycan/LPS O-acetylase OafA/YrhL
VGSAPLAKGGGVTKSIDMPTAKTLPELDGIRAASILLVLATHLLPVGPDWLGGNHIAGLMGMSLFFCLSGFLITKFLWESADVVDFFRRRLARIVPLLYLYAFIVGIIVNGRPDSFVAAVLFYINYDDRASLDTLAMGHLWSLCVEVHFYLAIGVAVWIFGRRGFWLVPAAALAVLFFRIEESAFVSIRTHLRVDEILGGSLLFMLWSLEGFKTRASSFAVPTLTIAIPLWLVSCLPTGTVLHFTRGYLAAAIVGGVLTLAPGLIKQVLGHAVLRYIARVSYALYVWHPLMAVGWLGSGDRTSLYLAKRPITFALTFVAAHISTHTLEAYFRRIGKRKTSVAAL